MSAWIPAKVHIDLLVDAVDLFRDRIDAAVPESKTEIGQALVDEVVASVSHRYPRDTPEELPGPLDHYYLEPYEYVDHRLSLNGHELNALARCYAYQACEHPGWALSMASFACEAIAAGTPEFEDGVPWGWGIEDVNQRKVTRT